MITADTIVLEQAYISLGGREILKGAAIRAQSGRVTGLLGSNGSGKSTMLKILFGALRPSEAIVSHNGQRLPRKAFEIKGLINYLPQHTFLPSSVPMGKLLNLFNVDQEELLTHMPQLAEDLPLTVHQLSGGKLRIWQTMLLLLAPTRFTLLDEPFTQLAPVYAEQLGHIIRKVSERKGLILTDHLYKSFLPLADELWFMKGGKSFLIRSTEDLVLHGYLSHIDI